jgi:hypothetical protein
LIFFDLSREVFENGRKKSKCFEIIEYSNFIYNPKYGLITADGFGFKVFDIDSDPPAKLIKEFSENNIEVRLHIIVNSYD